MREFDNSSGNYGKDYCRQRIAEVEKDAKIRQEALDYYKLHKDEIKITDQNTFLYKGEYYDANIEVAEAYLKTNIPEQKAYWENELKNAPQYRTRRTKI